MLVLSRKETEKLLIGDNVVLTINRISGNRVAIGIQAPRQVRIARGELQSKAVSSGGDSSVAAIVNDAIVAVASKPHA